MLSNAIQFSRSSKINIKVTVKPIDDGSDNYNLIIIIQDFGSGIPRSKLDTIFHPYVYQRKADRPEEGSRGLGLSVSKFICKKFNGDLTVESVINKGTLVTINIKIKRSN